MFHVDSEAGRRAASSCTGPISSSKRLTPSKARPSLRRRAVGGAGTRGTRRVRRSAARPGALPSTSFGDLLAPRPWRSARPGRCVLDRVFHERRSTGRSPPTTSPGRLRGPARPGTGAVLVGGMTKREVPGRARGTQPPCASMSWKPRRLPAAAAAQPPLHPRDTSAWIYDGVSINAMRWPARQRETVHFEAIYRHPSALPRGGLQSLWSRAGGLARPPSRAATCSSSATARCSSA